MKIGFVGLGNVGGKLAGSLLRNGYELIVRDLDEDLMADFRSRGAQSATSARDLAEAADVVVTCLPSPAACAAVMEAEDGILTALRPGMLWMEMSTTEAADVQRMGALVSAKGAFAIDCPVSGGCHRAATGNISIFAGGERDAFEKALPLLTTMGRRILHTGPLGSASQLKVVTNYLCTVHLGALAEALTVSKKLGLDMNVTYEAIKASSGNSFVHETESQVILNGSRDISFTMDLVCKDVGLFDDLAAEIGVPLEISPVLREIFEDGQRRFGPREHSPNIIRRLEEAADVSVLGRGFPAEITDNEPEEPGREIQVPGRADT